MLEMLGNALVRRRRWVLVASLVGVVLAAGIGGRVADHLTTGGFDDPATESERAAVALDLAFGQGDPNLFLLVTANEGSVNDPGPVAEGQVLTEELMAEDGVTQVVSHFMFGPSSPLQSSDGRRAIIAAQIVGDDDEVDERVEGIRERFTREGENVTVGVGGFAAAFHEIGETIREDLASGELIAIPITLILLVIVFGSVVAASLPLAIGVMAIMGAFLFLRVLTEITDVSIFALNMVTALGLGLAIDYSLFIVSRFREEMRRGADTHEAVVITVRTAGRTIIFSGITVGISLSALLLFPLAFLRSFAWAGIGVVTIAVLGAVVFLPAVLAALGPRVDNWALWQRRPKEVGEGFWHRLAMLVMRRPVPVASGVVVVLLLLGTPFLSADLGLPDDRVIPPGFPTRDVHDVLREEFSGDEVQSTRIVATGIGDSRARIEETDAYAAVLSSLDGVERVEAQSGVYASGQKVAEPGLLAARFAGPNGTWLQVVPSVDPLSAAGQDLVREVRAVDAPYEVLVGGPSAQIVDTRASIISTLPWAVGLIGLVTFLLLFMMFGSLLVPLKAIVLNLLSLSAMFGAMVWIFQQGNLSGILNFTPGPLDITSPVLMFCLAFGLSMDYEVFLLSRIKEEYDKSGDNVRSVALGLERTGRIVTAAALIISVVFLSIGLTSSVRFIKLLGIGMALAVLMDAFVIRGTLVPAFMRLAGRANWWLPEWLRPLHARVRVRESDELPPQAPAPAGPARRRPKGKPRTGGRPAGPKPKAKARSSRANTKAEVGRSKAKAGRRGAMQTKPVKRKPAKRKATPKGSPPGRGYAGRSGGSRA